MQPVSFVLRNGRRICVHRPAAAERGATVVLCHAAPGAGTSTRSRRSFEPADVRSKTLLVYGSADPIAGSAHGSWWRKGLPNARLEMLPGAGHLLIIPVWGRVLSHLSAARGAA